MSLEISPKDLAKDIKFSGDIPDIYLGVAPCRSGTTAQLRVFAGAGIESWYQPIKALLRYRIEKIRSYFMIPNIERIFLKETLGPYTEDESSIDPLEVLLETGIPPDRLAVIIYIREALVTVCSWIEQFSFNTDPDQLVNNAILAFTTVDQIVKKVDTLNIRNTTFDYRVLELNESRAVLEKFFSSLNLALPDEIFADWSQLPKIGTPESNIFFADEPELYMSQDFHKKVNESSGLRYFPKGMSKIIASLSREQVQRLIDGGVFEIYEN